MNSVKASKVEASCIVYSTEDLEKVQLAFTNIFPEPSKEKISVKKKKLNGHYGNTILILRAEINDMDLAEGVLRNLSQKLGNTDKDELSKEFGIHLDDRGNLYLRLDKQAAYMNRIRLKQENTIKIKISVKKSKKISKELLCEYYRRIGLLT